MWDVGIPSILHHTLPLNGWVWDKQARPNFILISNDVRPHSHIRFNQCGILQFHPFYVTKYDKVDLPLVYLWSTKSMQAWIFALKSGSNCKEGATQQRPRVVTILKKLVHLQSVSNMVWKQSCAWKVKMRSCRQNAATHLKSKKKIMNQDIEILMAYCQEHYIIIVHS